MHKDAGKLVCELVEEYEFIDLLEIIGAYAAQQAKLFEEAQDPQASEYWEKTWFACSMALGVYASENVVPFARAYRQRLRSLKWIDPEPS
jgi:hypothetical protein